LVSAISETINNRHGNKEIKIRNNLNNRGHGAKRKEI
jgi:hypothetical protein